MKKLVLHIGMAKTGTTSIQETLGKAHESLRDAGVIYSPERPYNHSYRFAAIFKNLPRQSVYFKRLGDLTDEQVQEEVDSLKAYWSQLFASRPEGTWIISAESLSGLIASEIQALKQYTAEFFDQILVIAYVRHPTTAIKSQWEQNIKSLEEQVSADELLALTKRRYNYEFLENWVMAFGSDNIVVRPFDRKVFRNGDLIEDFLHSVGITDLPDTPTSPVESNQSLGRQGTAFLLEFNKKYPKFVDEKPNEQRGLCRQHHLFYSILREVTGEPLELKIRFNSEEAESINAQIRYINRHISAEHCFEEVPVSNEATDLPNAGDIPIDYYIELVNAFAKQVEKLGWRNKRLLKKLEESEL